MNDLAISVKALLQKVAELQGSAKQKLAETKEQSKNISEAGIKVSASWSGSYAGYHAELYYADFEKPPLQYQFDPEWGGVNGIPNGWRTRTSDEVKDRIERLATVKVEQIEKHVADLVESAKALQRELLIELSGLYEAKDFSREKELLKRLEELKWKSTQHEFINANLPKTFMSRDSRAMSQGICLPAHMYYEAIAYDLASQCKGVEALLWDADQLLRQLQRTLETPTSASAPDSTEVVSLICQRFHTVARQLLWRHVQRPP